MKCLTANPCCLITLKPLLKKAFEMYYLNVYFEDLAAQFPMSSMFGLYWMRQNWYLEVRNMKVLNGPFSLPSTNTLWCSLIILSSTVALFWHFTDSQLNHLTCDIGKSISQKSLYCSAVASRSKHRWMVEQNFRNILSKVLHISWFQEKICD